MAAGGRRGRRARARAAAAALLVGGLALAGGALPGAEAGRRRRRGPKIEGVVAARACAWAPDPAGGGGRLELSEVATSEVFTVSPKRRGWSASPEALVRAFAGARKPRNVALTAWPSGGAAGAGGAPRYLVGELVSAEPGPPAGSGLQLRLRMSDAQARASAPPTAPPPGEEGSGFQAASCSLFLDAVSGSKVTQAAPLGAAFPDRAALKAAVDSCLAADLTGANCRHDGIPISDWDVSRVTDMNGLFAGERAEVFSADISKWNTAAVTRMDRMFDSASAFNQDISSWNTAAVTRMDGMFHFAETFNQDLSSWNTAAVTDMEGMFFAASAFNGNISSWNTATVTDMSYMFNDASAFNQDLSSWDVMAVTNNYGMWIGAAAWDEAHTPCTATVGAFGISIWRKC